MVLLVCYMSGLVLICLEIEFLYLFLSFCRKGHLINLIFFCVCVWFGFLIDADIEHSMSIKGLKLLGTRSSCMISCKALKILRGFTVKFISWKHWSTETLWSSTLLGSILLIGTSTSWLKCSHPVHLGSKFFSCNYIIFCPPFIFVHFRSCIVELVLLLSDLHLF